MGPAETWSSSWWIVAGVIFQYRGSPRIDIHLGQSLGGRVIHAGTTGGPPFTARKSLFGGFSIKCHIYFRAYVKNPQMNCKLFSVATGMAKTQTRKSQPAVFESSELKSNIFWLNSGHLRWAVRPPTLSSPHLWMAGLAEISHPPLPTPTPCQFSAVSRCSQHSLCWRRHA